MMSRRFRPLWVMALFLASAGTSFAQIRTQLPREGTLARLGLERAWWSQATIDYGHDQIQFFTSDEQVTFVQTDSGIVTAIDNASGRRRWSVQVGAATDVRFPVTTSEHLAMIVSGRTVYALDKKTGNEAWHVLVPSPPSAAPGSDETHVYVGAIDGNLYAFSTKILDQLMRTNELSKYGHRVLRWQYKTGGRIQFPPVAMGTIVHVASSDGSLYGLLAADCKLRYQFETDRPTSAPLALSGNQIFLCSADRKLYCLRADTGALSWEKLTGLSIRQAPRAIGGHVFLLPTEGGLRCHSSQTGRLVWANNQANGFLAATPTTVYASAGQGDVLVLNRADGRPVGSFALPGFPLRIANDRTDRMYFASERGLVICIRERDREFPLYHKVPEKRPVLPEVAPEGTAKPAAKKADDVDKAEKKEEGSEPEEEKKAATPSPAKKPAPRKSAPSGKPAAKPKTPAFDTGS